MLSIYKREFGENTENVDCSTSSPPDTPGTASGKPCYFLSMQIVGRRLQTLSSAEAERHKLLQVEKLIKNQTFSGIPQFIFFAGLSSPNKKVILFSPPWYFVLLFVLFPKHCMVTSGEWLGMDKGRFKWGEHGTGMIWLSREPSHAHRSAQKVCVNACE